MSALALGLVAALCWGFHDICVRFLSRDTPISACIFVVILTGLLFHLGLMTIADGFAPLPARATWLSAAAGVFFIVASFGLYHAFERGPVRLVAPVIASYPILSVAWSAASGVAIAPLQGLAVLAIVAGVGAVAALSDSSESDTPPIGPTILFALISAVGFAGTFALGQAAAEMSGDMPSTLVTRLVAIALVVGVLLVVKLPFWPGRRAVWLLILMGCADGVALLSVLKAGTLSNAHYASVSSSMFGLLTIMLAWVFLKERMTSRQWIGCLVAFSGIGYLAL